MNTPNRCPQCDATLPVDAPDGLCPRCLLGGAVAVNGEKTELVDLSDPPEASGTTLRYLGDYELLEEIARGGMGVVYRARQVTLNRIVAVKMILAGNLAGEEAVQRFLVEAEAAANLQHPDIVAIHEIGQHKGQHFFSMDYVEGESLARKLEEGPLPAARAAGYLKTIAEAIHFAHQRGTLHRDLKPQNILLDEDDRPRITDFGLARPLEGAGGLTETGAVMGSPSYMPPEQARGELGQLGPASDVYALGAMLYEMLTGVPPFVGESTAEILHRLTSEEVRPPRQLDPEIPMDLQTICMKCLEKEPELRYASARALAEDLGRFLEGEPVLARPAGLARRLTSWAGRHPWAICALVSLVLIGALGLAYGLWVQNDYLRWTQAHPGETPPTREFAHQLQQWEGGALLTFVLMSLGISDLRRRSLGTGWKEHINSQLDPKYLARPACRSVGSGALWGYGLFGLAGLLMACLVAAQAIESYVWRGVFPYGTFMVVYPCAFFALGLLAMVRQLVRRQVYGKPVVDPVRPRPHRVRLAGWSMVGPLLLRLIPALGLLGLIWFALGADWGHPLLVGFLVSCVQILGFVAVTQLVRSRLWWRSFLLFLFMFLPVFVYAELADERLLQGRNALGWLVGMFYSVLVLSKTILKVELSPEPSKPDDEG